MDSASCHIDLAAFEFAKKNQVYLYALLKNATHLNQPADVGLFGVMKQSWYKNVRRYSQKNPNTDINKRNFCYVFKDTWEEVMSPSVLIDAFRKSGIYPINRQQISNDRLGTSVVNYNNNTPLAVREAVRPMTSYTKSQLDAAIALSSLSGAPDRNSTSIKQPEEEKSVPSNNAFEALESTLESQIKQKYRQRMEEGYDMPGSPVYRAWKALYTSAHDHTNQNPNPSPLQATPPVFTPHNVMETRISSS